MSPVPASQTCACPWPATEAIRDCVWSLSLKKKYRSASRRARCGYLSAGHGLSSATSGLGSAAITRAVISPAGSRSVAKLRSGFSLASSHQAHPIADAALHFRNVPLLAPIENIESRIGEVVEAGVDFGVVVVKLDPVLRKSVADALQVRMRELQVMLLVDEPNNIVEDEDTLD